MTPADERRLQELCRREYRSLLQYARGAALYANGDDRKLLNEVMRIAAEEGDALDRFGEFLSSSRVALPYLGSFPVAFTDLNFVRVRYLLPRLIAEQKQDLAKVEADRTAIVDAAAIAELDRLIDLHRQHLKVMEEAAGSDR
jgi:hypothetical protein